MDAVYDPERPSSLTPGEAISIAEAMLRDEIRYEIRESLERFVFASRLGHVPSEKWQKNYIGKVLRVAESITAKQSECTLVG
ncbi:hypothetical protein L5G28_16380 [Gordonia sp. HY285]|uniref:hypothetical protein n=1 Tax=Gordonia liuliyuniae TaxID=2911517 RepID=UPI001F3DC384|nr:hypothetical protein [Gordonia liuliyuniae]MCF8611724.1 hypothetical protein [Gordonia liuliyuniae]